MISNDKIFARDLEPIPVDRDDMDKAEALTIQVFLLLGAALFSIGGRLYVRCRQFGVKDLGLDDGLVVAGMILFVLNVMWAYIMTTQTQWTGNRSVMNGQAGAQSTGLEYHLGELGSKLYLYSWLCYSAALWTFKAAFLAIILRRLARFGRRQTHRYLGFGFLMVTWAATMMALFQHCRPLSRMWPTYSDPGQHCQPATSPVLVWVCLGFDIITNLYLAFAAVSVAAREGKPTRDKLQWFAAPVCGLLATGAAIARAVILSSDHNLDVEQRAEAWAIWQIFIFVAAVGFAEVSYQDYSHIKDVDATSFKDYICSSRFSTRRPSLAESEATIVVTPELTDLHDKLADMSVEEIMVEGCRTSGIRRKVEVSVVQESFVIAPEGPCNICGNYTKSWANDEDANKPEQRSTYFGGNVHFHVPSCGIINKEQT